MQISCPQCATTYELDERVLPVGGAPVQCTRCSHVFTAAPPQRGQQGTTQLFGAPKFEGDPETIQTPPPPKERTQLYGGTSGRTPAGPRSPLPSTTQIFGAPRAPAEAARTTQRFGSVQPGPPQPIPTTTQMFGAPPAARPDPARTTQLFGAVPSAPPRPIPATTQMFGRPAAPEDETPRLGTPGVEQPAPGRSHTPMFGVPAAQPLDSEGETPPFGAGALPTAPPHRPTPMFGTPSVRPGAALPISPEVSAPAPQTAGRRQFSAAVPRTLEPFDFPEPTPAAADADDDPAAELHKSRARRRNGVFIAAGAIALVAIGVAGYRYWSSRKPVVPPEAITGHTASLTTLRRDDTRSLEEAASALGQAVRQWPFFADAGASHLTALLFQLDDARMHLNRLNAEATELNLQVKKLQDRKQPGDWRNRVNALIDQLTALKAQSDPLVERAAALDEQVNTAFKALQAQLGRAEGADELQLVRAQAMYFGVKGSDQAIILAERYRSLGGTEGWGEVAYAEYALNTRVAPDTRKQAIAALETLKAKDPSFIRLYVLIGRLALADKQYHTALASFESATTLNPRHDAAAALRKQAERLRAENLEVASPAVP